MVDWHRIFHEWEPFCYGISLMASKILEVSLCIATIDWFHPKMSTLLSLSMAVDRRFYRIRFFIWLKYIELRNGLNQFEMLVSSLIHEGTLKIVLFQKETVLREKDINREIKSRRSQFSYTYVLNDNNILSVVTHPSIHHSCSTWKTLWEGKLAQVNKENFGCCNVRNT